MTAPVLQPPPWAVPGAPLPAPRPRVLVAAAAAVLLAAGWLWTGLHPTVTPGAVVEARGLAQVTDTYGQTTWQGPATGGALVLPVRNDGPLPVTLSLPDTPLMGFVRLTSVGPGASVALRPGRTADVVVQVGVVPPYCGALSPGTRYTALEVDVRVRTLGLPSTQRLRLPLPVQVTSASPVCTR